MAQVNFQYTEEYMQKGHKGFPTHFVSPDAKKSPKYLMLWAKAIHEEDKTGSGNVFRSRIADYKVWREYARGMQEIDQYKELLGPKKKRTRGKRDNTWRNLDFNILPIAPKFVQILQGMIMAQPRIMKIRAIDSKSMEAERVYENELSEWVTNRDWVEKLQQRHPGMNFPSPIRAEDPDIQDQNEIPLYKDLFYKDEAAMEMKDTVDVAFEVNDMEQIREDYINDIIEVGVGGTRTMIDSNGFLKIRKVTPERLRSNNFTRPDGGDIRYIGEYVEMSIADLKQIAGNEFSEAEYKDIAEKATGKKYDVEYFEDIYTYPWDGDTITVLDFEMLSTDERTTNVSKDRFGNWKSEKVAKDFLPKGVSDDMYKERYNGDRYIMRRNVRNRYQGMWIVDTNYICKYGLSSDMARQASSLHDTQLTYTIYTTRFDSVIRRIMPALDQIQINWLQFQNHVARSKPPGLSIEMSALENLNVGKAGERMTPKEALRLYFETGVILWRMKNWSGAMGQWRPVQELNNGIGDAAAQHFQNILSIIDVLRNILGLNQVEDASTPNPEIGKFVTETATVATKHALTYAYFADKKIYEGTAKKCMLLLPNLISRGKSKGLIEALGTKTYNFFKTNIDLSFYEFSLMVEAGATDDQQAAIRGYIAKAVEKEQLDADTALLIEQEENPYKAIAMIRHEKRKKFQMQIENQKFTAQLEENKNIKSANAAAQAEVWKERQTADIKMQLETHISDLKQEENALQLQGEIILAKLNGGIDLTETEKQIAGKIMETRMKTASQEKIANIKARAQIKAAKEQPKLPMASGRK